MNNESEISGANLPVATLLIVDDEETIRETCAEIAKSAGLHTMTAATTEEALEILERHSIEIVLTDLRVPDLGGIELLRRVKNSHPQIGVAMLTQYGSVSSAVEAMNLGAVDYIQKPFESRDLLAKLDRLVQQLETQRENRVLREQLRSRPGYGGLIGTSPKMQRVYKLIEKTSQHRYPVLILGESGTGKELVARSIHFSGPHSKAPFVPVDCSALAPTLIESELFGHVKGAFTGAAHSKQGLLESAQGGTVFFDEIGELPVDLQSKLLRVLQEKEVRPVGSTNRVPLDVRIISATNRELDPAIQKGTFRQDLFFRLNVVQIKLPPLRDRKSDIPILVQSFLEKFNGDSASPVRRFSEDAMARLMAYDWPGNVRELENAVERAVALGAGPLVQAHDLPSNLQQTNQERMPTSDEFLPLAELERRAIFRALRETGGDKLAAARLLQIGKTTLYRKLKEYGEPAAGHPPLVSANASKN